jgi:hypothetical protein
MWFEFQYHKIPDDIVFKPCECAAVVETERIFVGFVDNPGINFLSGIPRTSVIEQADK